MYGYIQSGVPSLIGEEALKSLAPQKNLVNWRLFAITSLIIAAVSVLTTTSYMAPLTGAIFTTGASCDGTNINIFTSKTDVYVDGGPAHQGAAGLPDGFYYIQVTEPGGALLGTSVAAQIRLRFTSPTANSISAINSKPS